MSLGIVASSFVAASGGGSGYADEVLALSPLVYWRLGESSGSTANDASGNARHGTYNGSPTLGATGLLPGDADTAVSFDGTDDSVSLADAAWMDVSNLTALALIKPDTVSGSRAVVGRYNEGVSAAWLLYTNGANAGFIAQDSSLIRVAITNTAPLSAGETYMLAGYADGTNAQIRVYDDTGTLIASRTSAMGSGIPNRALELSVGRDAGGNYDFDGVIDEVAVFGSALSTSTIDDLAAAAF